VAWRDSPERRGPKGDTGDPGPVGLSGYQRVSSAWTPIALGAEVTVFVICPNGKRALGGGPETSPPVDLDIIYSGAFSDSSWAVRVASDGNFGRGTSGSGPSAGTPPSWRGTDSGRGCIPAGSFRPAYFALASTAARARRAIASLRKPMPHFDSIRRSTRMRTRSASAPCHQPNFAPATIQACW
jgi:hypothetical protein